MTRQPDKDSLFRIRSAQKFEAKALEIFRWQARENPVYRKYLEYLDCDFSAVASLTGIPFLPVDFFKSHPIRSVKQPPEKVFTSSTTTGSVPSRHEVVSLSLYRQSFLSGFEHFYGPVGDYCILALLPSYLERSDSSLVYMAGELIRMSGHPSGGFYLNNLQELAHLIRELEAGGQKTLLLGVTFALMDLAEQYPPCLKHTIVMETGGMKGRREEITRQEVHRFLTGRLGVSSIHSEYGMTELLSQAYSKGRGIFHTPAWMKVLIRDRHDPFQYLEPGKTGGINVIDLANLYSCSFIETRDLGRLHPDGGFEVLGRFDQSDVRGCNLMIED